MSELYKTKISSAKWVYYLPHKIVVKIKYNNVRMVPSLLSDMSVISTHRGVKGNGLVLTISSVIVLCL